MLYDRLMRNIQNRHKRIKHMISFINARHQRKFRKFLENPLSEPQVSGLGIHLQDPGSLDPGPTYDLVSGLGSNLQDPVLGSQVPPMRWVPGLGSRVPPRVPGLSLHFSDLPILKRTFNLKVIANYKTANQENR